MTSSSVSPLGVVVVSFNAKSVILECLESLMAAPGVDLHVVVVDNASTDGSADLIADWAAGRTPPSTPADVPFDIAPVAKPIPLHDRLPQDGAGSTLTLIRAPVNGGFAAGVNRGLEEVATRADIDRFWVLNPDCIVPPDTPAHFARYQPPEGRFSLMGGRVRYVRPEGRLQGDGGTVNRRTGVTSNVNLGQPIATTAPPDVATLDFISGANMVASRAFYEAVGPMREDYFLYYEEVDWALRRGALPLALCPEAEVFHHAGASIGSATVDKIASPFSIYFMYRGRLRFVRRFAPGWLLWASAYALAKAVQLMLKGHRPQAQAIWAAVRGGAAPAAIRDRLSPEAAAVAFAPPAQNQTAS